MFFSNASPARAFHQRPLHCLAGTPQQERVLLCMGEPTESNSSHNGAECFISVLFLGRGGGWGVQLKNLKQLNRKKSVIISKCYHSKFLLIV